MNKLKEFFNKQRIITLVVMSFVLSFFTVLIASSSASFLYRYQPSTNFVNDQNMFYYLGKMMVMGKTPYVEVFDHKGLYLFYYCALGYALGGRVGFFILQVITMSLTYWFMLLTLDELKVRKTMKIVAILGFFTLYCFSMQSPGDAEPQLPLLTLMCYFYARGLMRKSDHSFLIGNIIAGVTAGIAINVRASDALVPFAFTMAYLVFAIRNKKVKELFANIIVCVLALFFACLPPFIHSYVGGFMNEMYTAVIFDNFRYVAAGDNGVAVAPILARVAIVLLMAAYYVPLILNRKKMVQDEFLMLTIMGSIMFVIQMVIAFFAHYLIIMMTFYFIAIARFYDLFEFETKVRRIPVRVSFIALAVASMITYPAVYYATQYEKDKEITNFICETIPLEERQGGHVLAIGCASAIYNNANIVIGYGDFNSQGNHIKISSIYSKENFINYLKSGDCHYVIQWADADQSDAEAITTWISSEEGMYYYSKIPGKHVDIFKYVAEEKES